MHVSDVCSACLVTSLQCQGKCLYGVSPQVWSAVHTQSQGKTLVSMSSCLALDYSINKCMSYCMLLLQIQVARAEVAASGL